MMSREHGTGLNLQKEELQVSELGNLLVNIGDAFLQLAVFLLGYFLSWSLAIAWFAWWLWGVRWKNTWPVLQRGAWLAVVLAMITGAMVWSQIAPGELNWFGISKIPNFWWQLGWVALFTSLTLLCGWLQNVFGWAPAEIALDPPEDEATGDHGNGSHGLITASNHTP